MDYVSIKLEGISLQIGAKKILSKLSFSAVPSTISLIQGKSGSGKTSLLNVMNCLYIPDEGNYWIGGELVNFHDNQQVSEIRRHIGFFHQELALFEHLTLEQNLEMFSEIQGFPLKKDKIPYILEELGIQKIYKENISVLSGGERQRAAFSKLLVFDYPIILMDEPTNNLDPESESNITKAITTLKMMGKIVIVVSHSEKLRVVADSFYRMEDFHENENL